MLSEEFKNRLREMVTGEVRFDEPMSNHSTIKIGGPTDAFVIPANEDELINVLKFSKEQGADVLILGVGSNVLFRDEGVGGVVVCTSALKGFDVKENGGDYCLISVKSGTAVGDLVNYSLESGFSGFECLAGIPGTVGGAIYMNAGTHDGAISDTLLKINTVDRSGKFYEWPKEKIEFSYRKAKFPKWCAVLSADFKLSVGSKEEIAGKITELRERRKERHPLAWPSLGSIFKNPDKGLSAGELIDEAGLKGVRVGGARISNEHGNWIINEDGASSKDVEILIHLVKEKIKEEHDILLETEIILVGRK